ncbi:MAG: hypothetical protein ACRDPA_23585, partial [Solirubrobacteraceae bacterium]
GGFADTPVYEFEGLRPGNRLLGPAIIQAPLTTAVIPPGMQFAIDDHGLGILEAAAGTTNARPLAAGVTTS